MRKIIFIGIILISGMQFSCANDDDQDLSVYQQDTENYATGGEDGQILPPLPPPQP